MGVTVKKKRGKNTMKFDEYMNFLARSECKNFIKENYMELTKKDLKTIIEKEILHGSGIVDDNIKKFMDKCYNRKKKLKEIEKL